MRTQQQKVGFLVESSFIACVFKKTSCVLGKSCGRIGSQIACVFSNDLCRGSAILRLGILWKMKDVSAKSYFLHTSGYRNSMKMKGVSAIIRFCHTSGHRNSMIREGHLRYQYIFYRLLGIGILWEVKDVPARPIFLYFLSEDLFEKWRTSHL